MAAWDKDPSTLGKYSIQLRKFSCHISIQYYTGTNKVHGNCQKEKRNIGTFSQSALFVSMVTANSDILGNINSDQAT